MGIDNSKDLQWVLSDATLVCVHIGRKASSCKQTDV